MVQKLNTLEMPMPYTFDDIFRVSQATGASCGLFIGEHLSKDDVIRLALSSQVPVIFKAK